MGGNIRNNGEAPSPSASQLATLTLFAGGLVFCVATGRSLLIALSFGLLCICAHACLAGFKPGEILALLWEGLRRIANILAIFTLIGMMTGLWRLSGTIPYLIDTALSFIDPTFFALWCFLLCAALSSLIGTAFGTVSTLGVICMLVAQTAGFNQILAGGAILSGCYVGDRCSPMSSSASLVCAITRTNIYDNFKAMLRTCAVPFALACACYAALSLAEPARTIDLNATAALRENFRFGFWAALPAALILVFGLLRIDVKKAMAASVLAAAGAALFVQDANITDVLRSLAMGYHASLDNLKLLEGGGIASMANVIGIVGISSSYSVLIDKSGLLNSFEGMIAGASRRAGTFRVTTLVSLLCTGIACNQTLAILLTRQLCSRNGADNAETAMHLENSVVLLSAVLPWSIAFSMCSLTLQQGPAIIPFGIYLWLVPLWWCLHPSRIRQSARGSF